MDDTYREFLSWSMLSTDFEKDKKNRRKLMEHQEAYQITASNSNTK